MPPLGAHMSIAGGYYKSVEAATAAGCDCVQLFTKNNNQWRAKPITDDEANAFRDQLRTDKIGHPISHASYLINLASPDEALWKKSVDAMIVELERADQLSIPYVIVHPGSFTTSSESKGLMRISKALNEIHRRRSKIQAITLLENTAGQGTNLGWDFDHLGKIISRVKQDQRVGVCIDTCHAFAAGYELEEPTSYQATMQKLDEAVGIQRVKAFHLNDSKREFGSRVDRHEHIGQGEMGLEPFRNLLNDKRFKSVPMYLETPKGDTDGEDWDVMNLNTLKELIA